MASINLAGILRDPTGEFSYKNKIRFTHNTTTGQTLKGFRSIHEIEIDGAYDIDLEYGNVLIETHDYLNKCWISNGVITINSDTPATDLPSLLGITTPATDADLLVFQALVEDANQSAIAAALSETSAGVSETNASFSASLAAQASYRTVPNVSLPLTSGSMVEKLNGTLEFTRFGESSVILSGVSQTVGVDEPATNENGTGIFAGFDQLYTDNNGIETGVNGWISSQTVTSLAPTEDLGVVLMSKCVPNAVMAIHASPTKIESLTIGAYTRTITVKAGELKIIQFGSGSQLCRVNFETGSILQGAQYITKLDKVAGDAWLFSHSFDILAGGPTQLIGRIYSNADEQNWAGNASDGIYIGLPCLTKTSGYVPQIITGSTIETRPPDLLTFKALGNLPAQGKPFTIQTVCNMFYADDNGAAIVFQNDIDSFTFLLGKSAAGEAYISFETTDGIFYAGFGNAVLDEEIRYIAKYTSSAIELYQNGVLIDSTLVTGTPIYDLAGDVYIGSQRINKQLNSETQHNKIWFYDMPNEEIAARGGPDA